MEYKLYEFEMATFTNVIVELVATITRARVWALRVYAPLLAVIATRRAFIHICQPNNIMQISNWLNLYITE